MGILSNNGGPISTRMAAIAKTAMLTLMWPPCRKCPERNTALLLCSVYEIFCLKLFHGHCVLLFSQSSVTSFEALQRNARVKWKNRCKNSRCGHSMQKIGWYDGMARILV